MSSGGDAQVNTFGETHFFRAEELKFFLYAFLAYVDAFGYPASGCCRSAIRARFWFPVGLDVGTTEGLRAAGLDVAGSRKVDRYQVR